MVSYFSNFPESSSHLSLISGNQDVKDFKDENFDVKEWINKTFQQPEAAQNKEVESILGIW